MSSGWPITPPPAEAGAEHRSPSPFPPPADRGAGPERRIVGIDVARTIAIAGMVLMHTVGPTYPRAGENRLLSGVVAFAHGRAAVLFVVLAGVGIGRQIRSRRAQGSPRWPAALRASLVARSLLVVVIGVAMLADPDNPVYVIVHVYGVYFLVAALVLNWSPARLAVAGTTLLVTVPLVLARWPGLVGWAVGADTAIPEPWPRISTVALTGAYPVFPWVGFLLVGMAIGGLDLTNRRLRRRLAAVGLVAVVLLHATVAAVRVTAGEDPLVSSIGVGASPPPVSDTSAGPTSDPRLAAAETQARLAGRPPSWGWSLVTTEGHTSSPFSLAATAAFALAVLGTSLFVGRGRWAHAVAGPGRAALTLYVLHVFLVARGVLPNGSDWAATVLADAIFLAAATALAWVWFRRFRHGPLEALASSLAGTAESAVLLTSVTARPGPRRRPGC